MKTWTYWVIITKDNKLVAIDNSSGGYPFYVDEFRRAHLFDNREKAQEYYDIFNRYKDSIYKNDLWALHEVTIKI